MDASLDYLINFPISIQPKQKEVVPSPKQVNKPVVTSEGKIGDVWTKFDDLEWGGHAGWAAPGSGGGTTGEFLPLAGGTMSGNINFSAPLDGNIYITGQTPGIRKFITLTHATITSGFDPATGTPTTLNIDSADGIEAFPNAAFLRIIAGSGYAPLDGAGGSVSIVGGPGGNNGVTGGLGGAVAIVGGGAAWNGDAGSVTISGGGVGGTGRAGNVILEPGHSNGQGRASILFKYLPTVAQTDPNTIWNNNGAINIGAGSTGGGSGLDEVTADTLYVRIDGTSEIVGPLLLSGPPGISYIKTVDAPEGSNAEGKMLSINPGLSDGTANGVAFTLQGGMGANGGPVQVMGGYGAAGKGGNLNLSAGGGTEGFGGVELGGLPTVPQTGQLLWDNAGVINIGAGSVVDLNAMQEQLRKVEARLAHLERRR